jgi:hypothetical protein
VKHVTSEWQSDIPNADADKLPQNHVSLPVSGQFPQNPTQHTLNVHKKLLWLEFLWVKAHCHCQRPSLCVYTVKKKLTIIFKAF